MEKEKDGVWRTIRGRRIFIGKGEDLATAMKNSGKFSRVEKNKSLYEKRKSDIDKESKETSALRHNLAYKYGENASEFRKAKHISQKEKNRVAKDQYKAGDRRGLWTTDKAERQQLKHEELQKKLADYKAKKQSNNKIESDFYKKLNKDEQKKYDDYIKKGYSQSDIENTLMYKTQDERMREAGIEFASSELNKQSNNKYEKQYDSVVDRYNKDEKFRDMLKNEHDKTIEATRKEIKSFLQGKKYFEKNGIENEDDLYNQINDNYYNVSREDFDKIYKEEYDKNAQEAYETRQREGLDKFIQKTDMYGGEREYSNEDLKRMEDAGVRPMAHSYTGGGWEGLKYDSHLTTKEIGKRITDEMKKNYPDVKIARRGDNYSMGSSIDFNIMSSDKDLYVSDSEIDKMTDFGRLSVGNGFTDWAEKNVDGFKKYTHEQYTDNDVRKYAKEVIADLRKRDNQNVRGDEWYLSDYGKKVVSSLNKEADSYTYNDSDGMVDYFDHGTYMHISIGKWNKPYQVNESKKIKDYVSKKKSNHK